MHKKIFRIILVIGISFGLVSPVVAAVTPPWDPFFATPEVAADLGGATRPFGIAAGDFDGDGHVDIVSGRTTGNIHFSKGNGDGSFLAPTQYAWKQDYWNAHALAAGDINNDGNLDVIWGANDDVDVVQDGEVRVFFGNGDGTFEVIPDSDPAWPEYNLGVLIADIGTDAASLTVGDVDGDGDLDIIAGAIDGTNAVVKLLRNNSVGDTLDFSVETLISVTAGAWAGDPIYFPPTTTNIHISPWGLALGDVDGDGDLDLWVGDRAMYIYLYTNDGSGNFTLHTPSDPPLSTRPNALLVHDAFRVAVGYTPSLGSGDINGDGRADLLMGLHSGGHTTELAHDGEILIHNSTESNYIFGGAMILADIGMIARGVTVVDVNGDSYQDIVSGEYDGTVNVLRQLPPLDTDGDGISDYVDNAPEIPNAPRLDMNTDASINYRDQLDNDFDTVLGDPEDTSTWLRLGDPADPDDDNDGILDTEDNCVFVPNPGQEDGDTDGVGDACDPLLDIDTDGDGIVDGPLPGDLYYEEALAAKIKMGEGSTYFILRIDALSRWFQNEFTQIMTDAATLSPEDWEIKCWENYQPEDGDYEPCGTGEGTEDQTLTLSGGKQVPISLVVIPKQIWTDPPLVTWINDRNDYNELEIGQHGTYHANNTPLGDWADDDSINWYSCETCGLTEGENYELLKVGYDTLVGNYDNKWVAESGATSTSPKIDWSTSANPLISYAPPYNASDTASRDAVAKLGYKSFSASIWEENSPVFTPEGSHHEDFDQFGVFHASADLQVDPPETPAGVYNEPAYIAYLNSITEEGGLNTWLIEEVEWSGRPDNTAPREEGNRENNTVYLPRWEAWMTLLDFVKTYPDSVALTLGEVALAKAYDNAPTVFNPDQADANNNGIGDVIEGANLIAPDVYVDASRMGTFSATLTNGSEDPIPDQTLKFSIDADGDGTAEEYIGTTNSEGVAEITLSVTKPEITSTFSVEWDGIRITAEAIGNVVDVAPPELTITGVTADDEPMEGDLETGYILETTNNPTIDHLIQFEDGTEVNEALADEYFGLKLVASETTVSAEFLKNYYDDRGVPSPYLEYLKDAADGINPFVYLKVHTDLSVTLVDAAKHDIGSIDEDMTVPDDFPVGTYTVEGVIRDLAVNETTVTLKLIILGHRDPRAMDDEYTTPINTPLNIDAENGVLSNDFVVEGESVVAAVISYPSHGKLQLFADGSFNYEPDPEFVGDDTFIYQLVTYVEEENERDSWTDEAMVTIHVIDDNHYIFLPLIIK